MKFTPLDIQQQQFRTGFWGFDSKDVNSFLDQVGNDVEDLIRANNAQREQLRRKDDELQEHRERERTLKEAMITATRITEDIKQNARKEAEIVIAEAAAQAEIIIQNAHTRLMRVLEDIDELKRQKAQFEGGLRSMLLTHGKLLDAIAQHEHKQEAETLMLLRRKSGSKAAEAAPMQKEVQPQKVVSLGDQSGPVLATAPELLKPRGGDR